MVGVVLVLTAYLAVLHLFLLWHRYRPRLAELPGVAVIMLAGAWHREQLRSLLTARRYPHARQLPGFDGPYRVNHPRWPDRPAYACFRSTPGDASDWLATGPDMGGNP